MSLKDGYQSATDGGVRALSLSLEVLSVILSKGGKWGVIKVETEPNLSEIGEQDEKRVFKAEDIWYSVGNSVSGHSWSLGDGGVLRGV